MNVFGDLLETYAERNPDGTAVISESRSLTWKEVHQRTNRLANAFYELGLRKGDKCAMVLHNCPEFIETSCALQKIGAVPSPLNYRFVAPEIQFQVNHSDSRVLVVSDLWMDEVERALPDTPGVESLVTVGATPGGALAYEELLSRGSAGAPGTEVLPDDVASLIYTGGTTGQPKGVVTTYRSYTEQFEGLLKAIVSRLPTVRIPALKLPFRGGATLGKLLGSEMNNRVLHWPPLQKILVEKGPGPAIRLIKWGRGRTGLALKWLCVPPLFHMAAFGGILSTLWIQSGYSPLMITESPRFDAGEVLDMIDREKPSNIFMVPAMWKKVLEVPDIERRDLSSVILLVTGAGVTGAGLKAEMLRRFPNALLVDAFGQTEMTPVTTLRLDTEEDKLRDRSVGRSLPGLEVRIVGEDGRDVEPGQVGEIIYKSDWMMQGYYKEKERTSEVIRDGWFYSGDLGYFDEDGEVKVAERKKEVISTGGEKIFPVEVEEILERHHKVEHACLIGVPDDTYGHVPRAVIELKEGESATEEEIIEWCRGRMTGFKRPKSVLFTEDMPVNPVGKVLRGAVKQEYGGA
jgi:acyl-CoA synthetase (AMP-forming)/AMP-acid ligase II